jgi:transposase
MNKRSEREINVIGIDVSKAKRDVAWLSENNKIKTKVIENQLTGWEELLDWAKSHSQAEVQQLYFVMEATGVYHENLATW